MAFSFANLYQIGGNPSGFATHLYKSDTDTQATVSAAGYFNNYDDDINLEADDLVIVTGDQGGYILTVVSVSSGSVTTSQIGLGRGGIEIVTAANVITREESGKTFILNSATAFASTLPEVEAGLEFTFIAGATQVTGGNHTIVPNASNDNTIYGEYLVAGATVPASAEGSINWIADTILPGDRVNVVCDGTNWYVSGAAAASGAITFTT